jgi:glycosidase
VKTLLLGEMLIDSSSPLRVNPQFGDETTMKELRKRLDHRDMHLIVDLNRQLLDKNTDDVLTLWLTKYVDGVRIIKSNLLDIKENATKWINQVNSISKSTFKPKFIAFYPFEAAEYTFNPSTVIDRTLINVNKEEDFVQKIEKLNGDSFALGDFELNNQRISGLVQDKDKSLLKIYQSLVFLLKGTPYLLYGDELEFKGEDKHMRWDNSMNCGFSENKTIVVSNADCGVNVKRQKATGAGNTLTRLYKTMITLRNEPAFQWGEIKFSNVEPNLIAFIRKAERFESFIVVSNTDRNQTKNVDLQKLFNIKAVTGKVAHFFSIDQFNQEFQVDKEITMDNILLKFGELLVVKFD